MDQYNPSAPPPPAPSAEAEAVAPTSQIAVMAPPTATIPPRTIPTSKAVISTLQIVTIMQTRTAVSSLQVPTTEVSYESALEDFETQEDFHRYMMSATGHRERMDAVIDHQQWLGPMMGCNPVLVGNRLTVEIIRRARRPCGQYCKLYPSVWKDDLILTQQRTRFGNRGLPVALLIQRMEE